jgi:hypothetical protein
MSQLGVAVVRNEKLVAESGKGSGTQRKGNVRRWKPLPNNGLMKTEKTSYAVICGVCNSVRLSLLFVVTFRKCPINPNTNPNLVYMAQPRDNTVNHRLKCNI